MKIKHVKPIENYILEITTDDGRIGTFDVRPYLELEAFAALVKKEAFLNVINGGYYIEWDCGADLSADTVEAHLKIAA